MLHFLLGLAIGGILGLITASLTCAAGRADEAAGTK